MKQVFVDASAFIALFNHGDSNHPQARVVFDHATRDKWRLSTTNVCVYETHARIVKRVRTQPQATALRALDAITSSCQVVFVDERDHQRAWAILKSHRDKAFSFADALSFTIMHRLSMREAFSYDDDFRRYGRFVLIQ